MRVSELIDILRRIETRHGDLWIEGADGLLLDTSAVYLRRDTAIPETHVVAVYIGESPMGSDEAVRP